MTLVGILYLAKSDTLDLQIQAKMLPDILAGHDVQVLSWTLILSSRSTFPSFRGLLKQRPGLKSGDRVVDRFPFLIS